MQPINWTEKPGLHAAITKAGYSVVWINGTYLADDAMAVQAIVDSYDPLPFMRQALHASIAAKRDDVQAAGLVYTFPDGLQGTIQLRDGRDIANVNGQATAAIILQDRGVTAPVLGFRDEQNATHAMAPAEMIEMGMAVSAFLTQTYAAKWRHDGVIDAWDGSAPYDISADWPG